MRKTTQQFVLIAVSIFLASALLAPSLAGAEMREFSGRIDKIKKGKMIVDNRQGDKVPFIKVDETVVEGEKSKWKDLKKKDWVRVYWKMVDKPRKAYTVVVFPKKDEAGQDL
jgi:hypothetical protein